MACQHGQPLAHKCIECRRYWDRERYKRVREEILAKRKEKNARPEVKQARKQYREANKERLSAYSKQHYRLTIQYQRERSKKKYLANRERCLIKGAEWREKNREHHREQCRQWASENYDSKKAAIFYQNNKEMIKQRQKEYRPTARHLHCARQNERRFRKQNATPSWANLDHIKMIYLESDRMSKNTGIKHHVDHIYPLKGKAVCGLHVENNLQIIPYAENLRKSNKVLAACS